MEQFSNIKQLLLSSYEELLQTISNYLPNLLSAISLILAGLLLAAVVRWLIIRLSAGLDKVVHVVGLSSIPLLGNWPIGVILGWLTFWLIMLFFLTAAVEALGLPGLASWLGGVINHLPVYIVAVVSIIAGIWIGNYVRNKIAVNIRSAGQPRAEVLGQTLRLFIISFAVISAMSQVGLDVSLFEQIMVIMVSAILAGIALAFGLGAGPTLANVISSRYIRKTYRIGQRIRIDEIEGEILELLPTGVILDTQTGRTYVPAKLFGENSSVLLDNIEQNGDQ